MRRAEENMINAGNIFMFIAWLQGQMSDLVIFNNNPDLIPKFIDNPKSVPSEITRIRASYWEKHFVSVKKEFKEVFSENLTDKENQDIEEVYHLRNMIAHAHVSIARDYMLYRPSGGSQREQKLVDDLRLQSKEDQSDPMMVKIELWKDDKFQYASDLIGRIDQVTLKKVAEIVGIPHGRIR